MDRSPELPSGKRGLRSGVSLIPTRGNRLRRIARSTRYTPVDMMKRLVGPSSLYALPGYTRYTPGARRTTFPFMHELPSSSSFYTHEFPRAAMLILTSPRRIAGSAYSRVAKSLRLGVSLVAGPYTADRCRVALGCCGSWMPRTLPLCLGYRSTEFIFFHRDVEMENSLLCATCAVGETSAE